MPILNKQQLLQENNTNFPNNNDQLITPALLRQFNTDMIDSMQLTQSMAGYAVLSGSNSFIGNQNILGDLSIVGTLTATTIHTITESASVIYSSGSNQLGDELTDTQILSGSVKVVGNLTVNGLPIFTGSVTVDTGSLLTTASFNAYTQSNNQRVSSLEANTASVNTSISALNNFTQSQQALNGTFATTGSNTFTGNQIIDKANVLYTNGIYWNDTTPGYTNLEIINQAGGNLDFASLNGGRMRIVNTPLILTGSALTSSNDISTSANIYAANLTGSAINTGSLVTTASFNAYTQSNDTIVSSLVITTNAQQILINNLNAASASLFTSASNALVTASLSGQTLTFRKGDNSTFGITIPDVSGSDISALNAFTASQLQINSGYNTFTQSIQAEVDSLQAATSSYALSASVAAVDAAQQSQIDSLIAATGSYANSASFAASQLAQDVRIDGLSAQTSSYAISSSVAAVDAAQQAQINSLINATSSYADSASFAASQLAQDIRIDGLSAQTSSYVTDSETGSFARYDVSNPWSADQTFTNISAVSASFQYVQTIFETASVIYSSGSNQFGDELTDTQTLSGSVKVQGSLTVNGVPVQTSSVDISALNQATASLQAFTQSANIRLDNLEINSASVNTSIANINTFTQSADQRLDSIEAQSGSWVTSAITASSIITASVVDDDITFTKGDGTQFTIQVSTGSFAVSASYAETASIARNLVVIARNGNQSTLPIGTVVHITSAVGDNPIFNTASFDTELLSANTLGVLRQAAISGTDVEVVVQGTVTGVSTDPTLGYAAGDVIYLSSSGQFTRVQPQAPNQIVVLGQVLRAQQNNGSIYVSINNGWELNELHNVQINNPQTGDLIQYESSSYGLWKNKSIAGAGITATSSFNAYTSSTDNRLNSLEANSASVNTSISALNSFSASQLIVDNGFNEAINNLNQATSSLFASASLALVTASFDNGTRNLTFTKGDTSTFSVNIPDVSGSSFNTASFATTGSNTFTGNQTITTGGNTQLNIISTDPNGQANVDFQAPNSNFRAYGLFQINNNGQYGGSGSIQLLAKDNNIILAADGGFQLGQTNGIGNGIGAGAVTINVPTGSNTLQLTGSLDVVNTFTASLQQGYVWVGDASGRTTTVATSSFGGGATINTGSFLTTGSVTGTQNVFGTLQFNVSESAAQIGIALFNTGSDASGSMEFGVTGPGNPFIKLKKRTWFQIGPRDEIYYPEFTSSFDNGIYVGSYFAPGKVGLLATSGSLGLFGGNPTANRVLTNIQTTSGLANTAVNLVFANTGTTTTIVSGSNNIWTNPTGVTAGFNRYIGGNNNFYPNVLPQLTGSAAFPVTMANNISNSGVFLRPPVSSSTYTISSNLLMNAAGTGLGIGTSAANHFERAVSGLNITNNIVAGAIQAVAAKTPLSASSTISSNMIGGNAILNMDSSSINLNGTTIQAQLTVNNSYFPSTYNATSAQVSVNGCLSIGSHAIYLSGSNATFTAGRFVQNVGIIGNSNVISASLNGDNSNAVSTMLFGQALNVIGSNSRQTGATMPDYGSVFVGRWNAFNGNRGQTAETVFAVGTGNGASTRKTGFLIDSGSNTFVEGTFNVSGSSSFTGSTAISGALNVINAAGETSRFTSIDTVAQRIQTSLAFTGSRFNAGIISTSVDMENLNAYQFGFNQLALGDGNTGTQFILDTNKDSTYTEVKLNARYTGSATADVTIRNTNTTSTFTVNADTSNINGAVNISETLKLAQQDPLPTGATGMLAVSASVLWFYDATQWRQVSLI